MTKIQLQDNLNWLLLRVSFGAKQGLLKLAEQYNLTIMQALTLCLLEPGKPVPMNSISGMLSCDASNVTGIVDRLVANHYIERKENPQDRRVNTVSLTKKGSEVRAEFLKKIATNQISSLAKLSAQEIKTLKNLLLKALA